ncbi:hypothetical protein [Sphaerisporangium corydalis]|uniref:Uncharacterized protein n=1 Tax=Sphaerisporangium corydalis TaxID=1441875 RepID=A0ABV9ECK2_9ACTN|nr:hypothetical protein [Sphaerisporangium corydalis]
MLATDVSTPVQEMGTAAGLPHLVSTAATAAMVKSRSAGSGGGESERLEGALSLEPAKTGEPGDPVVVPEKVLKDRAKQVRDYNKAHPVPDSATSAASEQRLLRADGSSAGALSAGPPTLHWTSPPNNSTVTSTTPIIAAYATSEVADPLDWVTYWFNLCPAPGGGAVDHSRCVSSPMISNNDGPPAGSWKVPAGVLKWGDDAEWYVQVSDVNTGSSFSANQRLSVVVPLVVLR